MCPVSNQRAKLCETAKTHILEHSQDITKDNIKLRSTINQTATCTYNNTQVTSNYLKPPCKNHYTVSETQNFSEELSKLTPLEEEEEKEEDVSYDVESLFTNIQVKEIIIGQII